MAVPVGTNEVTSLSRRFLFDEIVDQVYGSNAVLFRLNSMNKRRVQGGYQIEVPLTWQHMVGGGWYQGFEVLDVSPSDTVKNAAWDWKQAYQSISIDGLTLIRADSPIALTGNLAYQVENAIMELSDQLGNGVWSDTVTNPKMIDGLKGAVDNGVVAATYGGITRASNPFWNSQVDSSTTTLSLTALQTLFSNCESGARHPTLIVSQPVNYNRYWVLNQSLQAFPTQPGGHDEVLAQAGFTNVLFDGVPWLKDSHVPTTPQSSIFMLNEDYLTLVVASRADFQMKEFREPANQDAMTMLVLWAGNVILTNPQRCGKMTALTA